MILAGDIGGTKANLALFEDGGDSNSFSFFRSFPSRSYSDLESIVQTFLDEGDFDRGSITKASLAVAGPVVDGICRATNLPWVIDSYHLAQELKIPQVSLLNDLEANAWSIEILPSDKLFTLHSGSGKRTGNRAVVSPGTGLGEAGIYWDGKRYHPFAGEGGHCEFGPRNQLQIDLCRYIYKKFGHASYERVLSGPGLQNIYHFFIDELGRSEPTWLKEALLQDDPAKVISIHGMDGKSELCMDALNLFVSIFGAETSNTVLKFLAVGGVYLGGGIPPKILSKLQEPLFYESFIDKGRFRSLLETVPIHVILDDKASLKGAAHYCSLLK